MKKKFGFTLIEAIVYLAIVSIVLVVIIGFSQRIISSANKSKVIQEVQQNARFSLERLAQDVRSAQSINADSTLETNMVLGGYLHLDGDDIYYQIIDQQLTRKVGAAGEVVAITGDALEVENFTVTALTNTNPPTSYQVEFSVKYNNPNNWTEFDWSTNLTTTLNIRHGN